MNIEFDNKIGNAKGRKAPIKTYRASPANFDAAAGAAASYAAKHNQDMVIVPGNSYGAACYHILADDQDIKKVTVVRGRFKVGVAKPNGDIFQAYAS